MAINLRNVSDDLHKALNVKAAAEGVSLQSLCVRFLWHGLEREPEGATVAVLDKIPQAGAGRAPNTSALGKPDMQALRNICAGNLPQLTPEMQESLMVTEIPICGKTWWEDGEQYECLMDAGHIEARFNKHGLRGMVRKLEN